MKHPNRKQYVFHVGLYPSNRRTVTVLADDYQQALIKARLQLDKRAEKRGQEPPVAWDLTLHRELQVMPRGKLLDWSDAVVAEEQHTQPCSDCPLRRDSLPGWLGGSTPEGYAYLLHSDCTIGCHVIKNMHCAGAAIYRNNVVKRALFKLPKNVDKVFATPQEFIDHHQNRGPNGKRTDPDATDGPDACSGPDRTTGARE